ncbi:hypothetical protein PV326_010542, partial [Microctonus aethiopoides]
MPRRHLPAPEVAHRYERSGGQGRHRVTTSGDDWSIFRRVRQELFVPANVVARNLPSRRHQQQPRQQPLVFMGMNDRRPRVWRRQGECFSQNFTRAVAPYNGGSVMVRGGVSWLSRTPP